MVPELYALGEQIVISMSSDPSGSAICIYQIDQILIYLLDSERNVEGYGHYISISGFITNLTFVNPLEGNVSSQIVLHSISIDGDGCKRPYLGNVDVHSVGHGNVHSKNPVQLSMQIPVPNHLDQVVLLVPLVTAGTVLCITVRIVKFC